MKYLPSCFRINGAIICIATLFWLMAWIWQSISDFFAEYLDFVFKMVGKFQKSNGGTPLGPRGGAEAGERSEATNGGRSGAPRDRRCAPV